MFKLRRAAINSFRRRALNWLGQSARLRLFGNRASMQRQRFDFFCTWNGAVSSWSLGLEVEMQLQDEGNTCRLESINLHILTI